MSSRSLWNYEARAITGEQDMRVVREKARGGGEVQPLLPLQGGCLLLQVLPEAALEERTQGHLPAPKQEPGQPEHGEEGREQDRGRGTVGGIKEEAR